MHGLFLNDVWMMCYHWAREREREERDGERVSDDNAQSTRWCET